MTTRDGRNDRHPEGRRDLLSIESQLSLVRQVCETLQYAHGNRVVHRGLTPCGKSRLLDLIEALCHQPLMTANASPQHGVGPVQSELFGPQGAGS